MIEDMSDRREGTYECVNRMGNYVHPDWTLEYIARRLWPLSGSGSRHADLPHVLTLRSRPVRPCKIEAYLSCKSLNATETVRQSPRRPSFMQLGCDHPL